jgi:NAD(P)-dependent dehydrogenase (short-subunit alcohol dehydrogenase family)
MKIAITGHTQGIGKALYSHWAMQGHDVVGISRQTGYDLLTDKNKIIEEVRTADVFVNNANILNCQDLLIKETINHVDKIITIGSALHHYKHFCGPFEYIEEKHQLFNLIKHKVIDPAVHSKFLHVGLAFLPHEYIDQENFISWEQIIDVIDFWIERPVFWDINFTWKATEPIVNKLNQIVPNLRITLS